MAQGRTIDRKHAPFTSEGYGYAAFTIGAEVANVINVAVALKDDRRRAITGRKMVKVYLSDAATGVGITGTTMSGSPAIHTNGTIIETTTTKKAWRILTDASGNFDLDIVDSAVSAYYMVIEFPDGTIQVSNIIQFA